MLSRWNSQTSVGSEWGGLAHLWSRNAVRRIRRVKADVGGQVQQKNELGLQIGSFPKETDVCSGTSMPSFVKLALGKDGLRENALSASHFNKSSSEPSLESVIVLPQPRAGAREKGL